MKKVYYIFIIIIIVLFVRSKTKDDRLRIRVIANSTESFDNEVKEEVVTVIKDFIMENFDIEKGVSPHKVIENKALKAQIEEVLAEKNVLKDGYTIQCVKEKFPTKSVDGKVIKGGKYASIVIRIGDGNGRNWWSLLYPEYFEFSFDDVNAGEVEFRSLIYDLLKKK